MRHPRFGTTLVALLATSLAACQKYHTPSHEGSDLTEGTSSQAALPASNWKPYNVADFGAKGDGQTDDTDAIQRCITTAEATQLPYYSGESGHPEILFPSGKYIISRAIIVAAEGKSANLSIRGIGDVILAQQNPEEDIFYIHHGYRQSIENIQFVGGHTQIKYFSRNKNRAQLLVRDCKFSNSASYAIDDSLKGTHHSKIEPPYTVDWKEGLPRGTRVNVDALPDIFFTSSVVHIDGCQFDRCSNVARLFSDWGTISRCSIVTHPEMTGAAIYSRGVLKISETQVQANTTSGRQQRFVDNINGGVMLDRVTLNADGPGLCPIYNRGIYDNGGLYNLYAIIDNCKLKAEGSEENCWVYCEEVPNLIRISDSTELSGKAVPAVGFRQPVTKEYLRRVSYPDLVQRLPELGQIYGYMAAMPRVFDIPEQKLQHLFSFSFFGNTNLEETMPELLQPFVQNVVPEKIRAGFAPLASGTLLRTPRSDRQLNVADFGAPGNGKQDDTAAIRNAVSAAAMANAELVFPGGFYRISETIELPEKLTVRGLGLAAFVGGTNQKTLFRAAKARRIAFVNAGFYRTETAVDLTTPAKETAALVFDHCNFTEISGTAIRCVAGNDTPGATNQTHLRVTDSVFGVAGRIMDTDAADALFDYNWLSLIGNVVQGSIVNRGTLRIVDCIGVPEPKATARWIDNSGTLLVDNMRFGGEGKLAKDLVANNSPDGRIYMRYSWLCCHGGTIIIGNESPAVLALMDNLAPPDPKTQTMLILGPTAKNDVSSFFFESGNIAPANIKQSGQQDVSLKR